jgi:hypothetical protein
VEELLGQPSDVVECGDYRILDYAGTPGEAQLSAAVSDSAKRYAAEQGLR